MGLGPLILTHLSYHGAVQYGAVSDRLVSPPPVQSLGLPGPARSCRRVPTCRRALHMLSLVRSLLITLTALRFCGPSSRLTCGLPARRRAGCSQWPLHGYSFYYSYSTLQLLYSRSAASTHTPATRPSTRRTTSHNGPAHLAHTHTHTHTHTGFFFKGFLPLDTIEPRISFLPNHISAAS